MQSKTHNLIAIAVITALGASFAGVTSAQGALAPATGSSAGGSQGTGSQSPASTTPATGMPADNSAAGVSTSSVSPEFAKLDRNHDGVISKAEATKNKDLLKQWTALDANKDNKLDQGEFAQFETTGSAPGSSAAPGQSSSSPAAAPMTAPSSPSSPSSNPSSSTPANPYKTR